MTKHKGGRGKKAPYDTTHIRIPVAIKDKVEKLKELYYDDELESYDNAHIENERLANRYRCLLSGNIGDEALSELLQTLSLHGLHIYRFLPYQSRVYPLQISLQAALHICREIINMKKNKKVSFACLLSRLYKAKVTSEDLN